MVWKVKSVTFDDFYTLRYPIGVEEDIVYPILRAFKRELDIDDGEFLDEYFRADAGYRKRLRETLCESLLDDVILDALEVCGYKPKNVSGIVRSAVDEGLATRKTFWFPDAKKTLITLRERGYRLGLISNTHWRFLWNMRKEFKKFFDVITLSYEHGYAKPHPSIFLITLKKMRTTANYCLHVGDDPISDIQGAKNVGMKTAFVKRRETKADADIHIERLSELTKLL
jgi:HAD superfamily hydrolase (TIGR01662 family)